MVAIRHRRTAITVVAAAGVLLGGAASAHADNDPCIDVNGYNHCWDDADGMLDPSPWDSGGKDATAEIWSHFSSGTDYFVRFHAYDEVLKISDNRTDGHKAVVQVVYHSSTGPISRSYSTGYRRTVQLGSSDNLAEGRPINIRLCIEHQHRCTSWVMGRT